MESRLRVGIVGAGVFAGYHANKVAAHHRAELVGIYDRNEDKARSLAVRHDCDAISDAEKLAENSDALIVAVPASGHASFAEIGLAGHCHLLIEKPMAVSVEDCDRLIEMADQNSRLIQIGHQERIVMDAIGLKRVSETPYEIKITRHSGRSERNLDTSVVMDLMIHDIDLIHFLFGEPDWVNTEAAKRIYSENWDEVRAELGYPDFTAYLSASRDQVPDRKWTLRYECGTVEIDFGNKSLKHDTPYALNADFGSAPQVQDSLATAFDRFVKACLDGELPLASGEEGKAAVRVASIIEGIS